MSQETREILNKIMAEARALMVKPGAPPLSEEELEREEARRKAAARADRKAALMARGVPAGAAAAIASESLVPTAAIDHARSWMRDRLRERHEGALGGKRALILAGKKDASKTTAASIIVEVWPLWRRIEECPLLVDFALLLGPWYHRPSESSPVDELTGLSKRQLLTASLLVLDDVGQESAEMAERLGEILDLLLKARCDADRYTVITTNYETSEGLLRRYGGRAGRIGERITEFGVWADCPKECLRGAKRREEELKRRAENERNTGT